MGSTPISDAQKKLSDDNLQDTQLLSIKIASSIYNPGAKSSLISSFPASKLSPGSSVLNSPALTSPPSSAFVSALQSPYISPRALAPVTESTTPVTENTTPVTESTSPCTLTSPISYSGSHSDDIPSTSYTPPTEKFDYSGDLIEQKQRFSSRISVSDPPGISFSFPVPRISFTKGPVSPSSITKLRSCDVYIGYHGQNANLIRFCKWIKSELELHGVACFVADRAKYSDSQSHEIADRVICSATYGIVVITSSSLLNYHSIEEIRTFMQKKNLIPLWFDTDPAEIEALLEHSSVGKDWREAIDGLMRFQESKLEANDNNWRACSYRAVGMLKSKLGRKSIAEKEMDDLEEIPFPRNKYFIGREKELIEIEASFFGNNDCIEIDCSKQNVESNRSSDGFADEESDTIRTRGRYISFEMLKCKEPSLEAWAEPMIEFTCKGRGLQKQRSKHKKPKSINGRNHVSNGGIVCINGDSGIGKSEIALEFAYRYWQRYKMVLWVGGEARYFRQNILNLSKKLRLDVSAELEKERGRIKTFDEQEMEAFQRVKRELFRDIPYLLIIDNLESEKEWWEGKDLHDLIPRNTGATHIIITTRLSKIMNLNPIQLCTISLPDAMILIKGRKKKDYPDEELDVLRKFDDKLGRMSFGLWVVGSLLSELSIPPSTLFEATNGIPIDETLFSTGSNDDQFCKNNIFLIKILMFCFSILDQNSRRKNLALKMVLAGAWFSPSPISSSLLTCAANKLVITTNGIQQLSHSLKLAVSRYSNCYKTPKTRKNETESAMTLVKLGLARRTTRETGIWIQFHEITRIFSRKKGGLLSAKAMVLGIRKIGNPLTSLDHLWASAFLVFGFKSDPPLVQLKSNDMVLFIKKTALPLAIQSFNVLSRCNASLELLKVCTNILEEIEKSFVSQIQDWCHGSLCWKNKLQCSQNKIDESLWRDVTLLKATLLEIRAKLLLRGGHFDNAEDLCRTCISIRTVMLGHDHASTMAAQETLARLVRLRSKV